MEAEMGTGVGVFSVFDICSILDRSCEVSWTASCAGSQSRLGGQPHLYHRLYRSMLIQVSRLQPVIHHG